MKALCAGEYSSKWSKAFAINVLNEIQYPYGESS